MYASLETILFEMDHEVPEREVARQLAMMFLAMHNRFLANSYSPKCDGRDKVCAVLNEAYEKLIKIEEE